jgi:hypothetical protein
MGTEREVAPPRRCGATRLGALLFVTAVPSALLAQEEPAPPNLPVLTNSRLTFEQTAQGDEIVAYVENLHVVLPARDLELWADHAVLWGDKDLLALIQGGERGKKSDPLHAGPEIPAAPGRPALLEPAAGDPASLLQSSLREIYAEGHVHFREGKEKVVFAERLYEHLLERRGIVVDCDLLALANYRRQDPDYRFPVGDPARDPVKVPLRVRAARLRLLGQNEVAADDAQFTTCRYGNPHYHVSARSFVLHVETDEELHESPVAEMGGTTLRYEGFPILPLPAFSARPDEGESLPLQRIRAGHSDRYGAYLQPQWGSEMPAVARGTTSRCSSRQARLAGGRRLLGRASVRYGVPWREGDKKTPLDFGEIGGYRLLTTPTDQETRSSSTSLPRNLVQNRWTPAEFLRLDAEMSVPDPGFQPGSSSASSRRRRSRRTTRT